MTKQQKKPSIEIYQIIIFYLKKKKEEETKVLSNHEKIVFAFQIT